ncbi:hypothetical protein D3875_13855 [Deinococcus cavernae]|uniref:Uncharacterized protein n=1 Tax=Deinococcus cavernae TaxID=2320857 RepID=A0A418V8Q1_9DEIO|nr:hypothetical protein [Deinococcus cavernae]RJF72473.1 hypothetical protein D3875_13855 [Deinococcus cavernae]
MSFTKSLTVPALLSSVLLGTALLSGCGSIARNAADNTPVSALPLAGAKASGQLSEATALAAQAINITTSGRVTVTKTFDDFDPSTLPGIVGTPSGLDVPLAVESAVFSGCAGGVLPSADTLTLTIKKVSLSVADTKATASTELPLNATVALTKTAAGSYKVNTPTATFGTLKLLWSTYSPVMAKSGTNTPNTLNLGMDVSVNTGPACTLTLTLSTGLKQNIRFQ